MTVNARGIDSIRDKSPILHEALKETVNGVNSIGQIAGINANGIAQTPQNRGVLSVLGADGIFHVTINDPSPQRGEIYFLQYDTEPSFANAQTIQLGASRQFRGYLGNQTLYWQHAKQLQGSNVSNWVRAAGPVTGGGTAAGPAIPKSTGSGASKNPGAGLGAMPL